MAAIKLPTTSWTVGDIANEETINGGEGMAATRYGTLDALRGVAAFAVVLFHLTEVKLAPTIVPHGYLAVDFFFILSGFVVAHAYEHALLRNLSWQAFFMKRIIRLYPLALLGAMMGLAVLLMKWHSYPSKVDPLSSILTSGLFNGLMLPSFFGGAASHHQLFPGNGPLWTLFFELLINLLWALFGVRMRNTGLICVALGSGMFLFFLASHFQTANIGFDIKTFWGGIARVGFGFTLGVLLFRFRPHDLVGIVPYLPIILGTIIVAIFAAPFADTGFPIWDLICIFSLLPIVVVIGAAQPGEGLLAKILGELSYPVYVLHFPILLIFSGVHQTRFAHVSQWLLSGAAVASVLVFATVATQLYDKPVRAILSRVIAGGRRVPAV